MVLKCLKAKFTVASSPSAGGKFSVNNANVYYISMSTAANSGAYSIAAHTFKAEEDSIQENGDYFIRYDQILDFLSLQNSSEIFMPHFSAQLFFVKSCTTLVTMNKSKSDRSNKPVDVPYFELVTIIIKYNITYWPHTFNIITRATRFFLEQKFHASHPPPLLILAFY